jgi:hypothetical protein
VVDEPTPTATETPAATSTAASTGAAETTAPEQSAAVTTPAHPSNYGGAVSSWAHDKNTERKTGGTSVPAKPTKSHGPQG